MNLRTTVGLVVAVLIAFVCTDSAPLQGQSDYPSQNITPRQGQGHYLAGDSVIVRHNVMVPTRDGPRLSTDLYFPAEPGRYPTILIRGPYNNGSDEDEWNEGVMWASRGYVYVYQNVQGRYDSEGAWYPYINEPMDSHDTQNWIGQQPWSNGIVGTYGNSYLATTQWKGAEYRSPYLKAITPRVTPFNYYFDVAYPGGALSLGSRIGWATGMGGRTGQSDPPNWEQVLWHLPLETMDQVAGQDITWWNDFVSHPKYDPYWRQLDSEYRIPEIAVPSLNIGGWYDVFLIGTLDSYTGMVDSAHTEYARENQKLLIGPWPHASRPNFEYEGIDFGPQATVDFDSIYVKWFDAMLKGIDNGYLDEPPVRIFVMGDNVWRSENEWPLARTQYTNYYFHSDGDANSSSGDGRLDTTAPSGSEPTDAYVYDPRDPVPTHGGNLMFGPTPPGPFDQSQIEQREDVLVYTTPPLTSDTEVTGYITVTLYAATSARDTDFTAKLVDVYPDGRAINLADGILRGRYRNDPTFQTMELITPGEVDEYKIDLWATSNVFKEGHRLRVQISSSNFPKYDRNLNTGNVAYTDTEMQTATQTIYHTGEYPSHITLPIIPRGGATPPDSD